MTATETRKFKLTFKVSENPMAREISWTRCFVEGSPFDQAKAVLAMRAEYPDAVLVSCVNLWS